MSLDIDRHLFTQIGVDSGSLTMLGSIVHSFAAPGEYRGALHRGDQVVAVFSLSSDKASPAAHADIDLAALDQGASTAALGGDDCCCPPSESGHDFSRFVVNPRGYALLRVSAGAGGYYVTVRHIEADDKDRGYDSRVLSEGDIFAARVLRPGSYEVSDEVGGGRGEIRVSYPEVGREPYRPPDPADIHCGDGGLEPATVELKPGQGVRFHADVPARVVIRLIEPDDGPGDRADRPQRPGWTKQSLS